MTDDAKDGAKEGSVVIYCICSEYGDPYIAKVQDELGNVETRNAPRPRVVVVPVQSTPATTNHPSDESLLMDDDCFLTEACDEDAIDDAIGGDGDDDCDHSSIQMNTTKPRVKAIE